MDRRGFCIGILHKENYLGAQPKVEGKWTSSRCRMVFRLIIVKVHVNEISLSVILSSKIIKTDEINYILALGVPQIQNEL